MYIGEGSPIFYRYPLAIVCLFSRGPFYGVVGNFVLLIYDVDLNDPLVLPLNNGFPYQRFKLLPHSYRPEQGKCQQHPQDKERSDEDDSKL